MKVSGQATSRAGLLFILGAVVLATVTVIVGAQEKENALAVALLQGITLVFGTVGSYIFGRESSREAAKELIRPHARSAFRRTRNLWLALGAINLLIAEQLRRLETLRNPEGGSIAFEHVRSSLLTVEAVVNAHVPTADDSLDDWRDLVPDEVARLEREIRERDSGDSH